MKSPISDATQDQLGLPAEPLWERRLFYNAEASIIVLSCVVSRDRIPYSRLYLRHVTEERYRPAVELPTDDFSIEGPVVCVRPFLFFILSEWVAAAGQVVGDYKGIGRLNLGTGEYSVWSTDEEGGERFFATELVGASQGGDTLYAVCGFRAAGGIGSVEYRIVRIDWEKRTLGNVADLAAIFF